MIKNAKEIQEIAKILEINSLIKSINRLAEAQEKANDIAARNNKISENQYNLEKKDMILEMRKNFPES